MDAEASEQSLREDIRVLVYTRNELREELRRLQQLIRSENANAKIPGIGHGSDKDPPDPAAISRKRLSPEEGVKGESAKEVNSPMLASKDDTSFPLASPTKRPRLELTSQDKKREKNLFGRLMGHLQKAKQRLDEDQSTKQAELQREAEQRVQIRVEKELQEARAMRLKKLEEEELGVRDKLRVLQWKLDCKETEFVRSRLKNHYMAMQNFIRTREQPTIFWVPHLSTERTKELQRETARQIEKKVQAINESSKTLPYEEFCKRKGWTPMTLPQ